MVNTIIESRSYVAEITEFNKKKKLNVTSAPGSPTIHHTMPIKITSGDDRNTGTGEIVLNWSNISTEKDIAIYNEKGKLLDYFIESFNETEESAVIHVYQVWKRDGSTQAQIAYGDGPNDQSVSSEVVFDKEMNNSGLISGWALNENSGNVLDLTSNDNDGTLNNGAIQGVTGQVGGAYSFDGSDDYVRFGDGSSLEGLSEFTINVWVKSDSIGNDRTIWRAVGDDSLMLRYDVEGWEGNGTNVIQFDIQANGRARLESSENVQTTEWQHLVGVWNGSELFLYIDGEKDSPSFKRGNSGVIPSWATDRNNIAQAGNKDFWDGKIDDVRIYRSALSSNEVKSIYDATKSDPVFFNQQAAE